MWIDLHIHTTFSDGNMTPDEIVTEAKKAGLSAIAFADHDSVDALNNYRDVPELDIVSCTEISAREGEKSIHILGYFIDPKDDNLNRFLETQRNARFYRAEKMVERLNRLGIDITMDEVIKRVGGSVIARPHIAGVLLEKGIIENLGEAFSLYIGNDKPCYVSKPELKVQEVADIIKSVGGIPVLAHPLFIGDDSLVLKFIDEGIDGIEVWHPKCRPSDIERYLEIAREKKLVVTGGSDSHGTLEPYPRIGDFKVDYEVLLKMNSYIAKIQY